MLILRFLLISCTAVFFIHWFYFRFLEHFIISLIHPLPITDFMPWCRWAIKELGGIKPYVLYALMFLSLLIAGVLNALFSKLPKWSFIFLLPVAFVLFKTIGFYPPMQAPVTDFDGAVFIYCILLNTILLAMLSDKKWISWLIILMLLPVCLYCASGISRLDYSCTLCPALRLLHGHWFSQTFFLYDYFLSIIAAVWMKLHLSIWTLPVLGRISFWVMLSGVYLFARKFFLDKRLAIFLVIAITILRIFSNTYPPDFDFNVTPFRLDLWLIVLALAFWKGRTHWALGMTIGVLIIFHHVFGTIYAMSYVMCIFILFIFDLLGQPKAFKETAGRYLSLYSKNFGLIVLFFVIFQLFFAPHKTPLSYFLELGIAFLAISPHSFYWYFPIIFSFLLLLLFKNRGVLAPRFIETGVFLITLAIGNSLYFLGRSHENNIINIAAVLILALFLLLDVLNWEFKKILPSWAGRSIIPVAATSVVFIISFFYAQRAAAISNFEWVNVKNNLFYGQYPRNYDLDALKSATNHSDKVIFLSKNDFFYYYEGGYNVPDNFQCNLFSWYIMKDYVDFLNNQLNNGYYIVVPKEEVVENKEILTQLFSIKAVMTESFIILSENT